MKLSRILPLLLMLPRLAMAWASAGHQVIAAEAYRQLSPQFKAQAIKVLKAHPDYAKWQSAYHTNASFDVYAYIFMRSSTWPDEIRRRGNKYDHPNWHFIDYPLRPPGFALEPGPKPGDDVLYGVARCEAVLSDTQADPELRAASLSFLIHLAGDMHQPPCVAVSLRKATYTHGNILARKAFTISIPSEGQVQEADYFGLVSGRSGDKFAATKLTPVRSELVDAPYVKEFSLIVECRLAHVIELGLHTQFVGEVMDVKAEDSVMAKGGLLEITKVKPLVFAPDTQAYYGIGNFVGHAFSVGRAFE
jgi:flavin reductase (DIM6/NTAB) family NADH-FMN oxidoreductase RutF